MLKKVLEKSWKKSSNLTLFLLIVVTLCIYKILILFPQKEMEEQTNIVENDRDELVRENEYLKAVLSNRTEIHDTKADEANRSLTERVKELEEKNTELVDEINNLYDDRQTLISSLLNLRSEEVSTYMIISCKVGRWCSGARCGMRIPRAGFNSQRVPNTT